MIEELTKACVHCGFCLPTCPTYVLWSEEMDSPRGRIQLMEKTAQGTLRLSPTVVEHFDRCLGCMACLSSCPSGVRYDLLIEETRKVVEAEHPRTRGERLQRRLLFATLPYPRRMRWAMRLAPLGRTLPSPKWITPMLDVAPRWRSGERPASVTPACVESTQAIRRVGLLTGCVQSVLFGDVNAATARVLAATGYEVVAPRQGCCGALSSHAGRADE
ncbi:MAG TPA: 4Fe-4S dicluster domain-containing protein, partial [Gaiella sp.]|nr:4Fe-4S dicluster domain-containing protein [Gaiella sp.]